MNGEERASIGIKSKTKKLLNYVAAEIIYEVGRSDLTWDDFLIYLSKVYMDLKEKNIEDLIIKNSIFDSEEFLKIRKKLKI